MNKKQKQKQKGADAKVIFSFFFFLFSFFFFSSLDRVTDQPSTAYFLFFMPPQVPNLAAITLAKIFDPLRAADRAGLAPTDPARALLLLDRDPPK